MNKEIVVTAKEKMNVDEKESNNQNMEKKDKTYEEKEFEWKMALQTGTTSLRWVGRQLYLIIN